MTILLNKPIGYVSGQAEDGYEPAVVLVKPENRWPEDRGSAFQLGHLRGLAPAGRLDIDSIGLLVLTQDGRIAKALIGEDSRVEKEYLVRVQRTQPGPLPECELALLRARPVARRPAAEAGQGQLGQRGPAALRAARRARSARSGACASWSASRCWA